MSDSFIRDLLVHAKASAKAGERAEARRLLERVLDLNPDSEEKAEAYYWLSEVSEDPAEQRNFLESVLAIDLSDGRARRKLAILNGQIKVEEIFDPNQISPTLIPDPQMASTKRFECPQCGGRMVFSPDGQSLMCEYCASKPKANRQAAAEEQDFFVALATQRGHKPLMAMRIFVCQGCHANFILPPTQLTITCPYCSSPHVIRDESGKEIIPPTGIIPFSINELQAKLALKKWIEKNLNGEMVRVRPGIGLYSPLWTFDVAGAVSFRYRVPNNDKKRPFRTITGEDYVLTNDYPIPATRHLDQLWSKQLACFELSKVVEFREDYLADWPAESYQVVVSDASLLAREAVFTNKKREIAENINSSYDELVVTSEKLRVDSYKLILLPLWITSYMCKERQYNVTINGQTGFVIGETPSSGVRKWIGRIMGTE